MKTKTQTFASRMKAAMDEQNVTLRALENLTGYSYEHLRKVRNGRPIHSREVCDGISVALHLDKDEMWELTRVDKLKARYGEVPKELVPPADDRAKKYWALLSKSEQEEVLAIMEGMARKRLLLEKANSKEDIVEQIAELSEKLGHISAESRQRGRRAQQ